MKIRQLLSPQEFMQLSSNMFLKFAAGQQFIMLADTDDSGNTKNSMNTAYIPQSTTNVLLQQQDPGSLDVVSLREGLSTSDRPMQSCFTLLQT